MDKKVIGIVGFMVVLFVLLFIGINTAADMYESSEQTITLSILDVSYKQGGWSSHEVTIVKTNESIIIFSNMESLPLGNVSITMKDPMRSGEYILLNVIKLE